MKTILYKNPQLNSLNIDILDQSGFAKWMTFENLLDLAGKRKSLKKLSVCNLIDDLDTLNEILFNRFANAFPALVEFNFDGHTFMSENWYNKKSKLMTVTLKMN